PIIHYLARCARRAKSTNAFYPIHDTSYDGFIVFTTPAGLTLYFLAGAIWSILQSLFTTFYFKPRIQAEVDKEMAENPIKVKKPSSGRKDVTDSVKKEPTNKRLTINDSKTNRNAG